MRRPHHRLVRLGELAERRRFRPHPALLEHHVALRVKLPEHRTQQPLRLHPHPQLQLVLRHRDEVARQVRGRERVHPRRTARRVEPVPLVLHDDLPLLRDQPVELLLQLLVTRRLVLRLLQVIDLATPPRRAHLRLLQAHRIAQLLLLGDDPQILLVILRAHRRRALEHHVLEEMRDARDAGPFIRAADVGNPAAGDGGIVVPFDHEHAHSVGQGFFDDGDLLRLQRKDERENQQQGIKEDAASAAQP